MTNTVSTQVLEVADLVDLERYPIDRLDREHGRELVERCRADLVAAGASQLEGFLQPDAVRSMADEALALADRTYTNSAVHNVYFEEVDDGVHEDDPRRRLQRSSQATVACDDIPPDALIRALYDWDPLLAFVGAALQKDPFYRNADPLGALNIVHYNEGDELGWHFDQAEFVVTLMLQPAASGGEFQYIPNLRNDGDENYDGVRRLLEGDTSEVIQLPTAAGTLTFFRGRRSIHRVTPIVGDVLRANAVLSFADKPDQKLNDLTQKLFYGRTG